MQYIWYSGPLVSNLTQGEGRTPVRCSQRLHLGGGGDLRGSVGANPRKEVCRIRLGVFSSGSVIHTIPYHTIFCVGKGLYLPCF